MHLVGFKPQGWEQWDVSSRPLIREDMPVLIDDDLKLEDRGNARLCEIVNRWLRTLPTTGAHSKHTWWSYARTLRTWLEFLETRDTHLLDDRPRLQEALSAYAEERLSGELERRLSNASWNQHTTAISAFYKWATSEGIAPASPFTYTQALSLRRGRQILVDRNAAHLPTPKAHASIKYLEPDFLKLLIRALSGQDADGNPDPNSRGRETARNSAFGELAASTGLRKQEFTYLLTYELPDLPDRRTTVPIAFPVAGATAKLRKQRTTWIDYEALRSIRQYVELERSAAVLGTKWNPPGGLGSRLIVELPDRQGAFLNGQYTYWRNLSPHERLRLTAPSGETCLVAVQSSGIPFLDWPTVFRRASSQIRDKIDPRFPTVSPHTLRHTFAMTTLERLVSNYYARAAELAIATDTNAALALYLSKADPLMILRDLLGHSSVTTTQMYLNRLDVSKIYQTAYESFDPDQQPHARKLDV